MTVVDFRMTVVNFRMTVVNFRKSKRWAAFRDGLEKGEVS